MPAKKPSIVNYVHRPKRPPQKKPAAAKIAGPAIFTVKGKPGRFGAAPDLPDAEHQRRGDAADELFRELVGRATKG